MRGVLILVVVGATFAAPVEEKEELLRTKKSYGAYGSPCAGAQPLAPVALYLSPQHGPHYREDEHSEATDARSYYGASGAAAAGGIAAAGLSGASSAGPAIGVFPNAKLGGCAVPLLLSCAPSVHSGHLAHQASYAAPAAYRAPEHEKHAKIMEETKMREVPVQNWEQSQRAIERPQMPAMDDAMEQSMMREVPIQNWEQSQLSAMENSMREASTQSHIEHHHNPAVEPHHHHIVVHHSHPVEHDKMREASTHNWDQTHSQHAVQLPHTAAEVHPMESKREAPVLNWEKSAALDPHLNALTVDFNH